MTGKGEKKTKRKRKQRWYSNSYKWHSPDGQLQKANSCTTQPSMWLLGIALDETALAQVVLDDNVYNPVSICMSLQKGGYSPLTAAMTKRICVVSVAHVKCV